MGPTRAAANPLRTRTYERNCRGNTENSRTTRRRRRRIRSAFRRPVAYTFSSDQTGRGPYQTRTRPPDPLPPNARAGWLLTQTAGEFVVEEERTSRLPRESSHRRDRPIGGDGSALIYLEFVKGALFFAANDSSSGLEPWTDDEDALGPGNYCDSRPHCFNGTCCRRPKPAAGSQIPLQFGCRGPRPRRLSRLTVAPQTRLGSCGDRVTTTSKLYGTGQHGRSSGRFLLDSHPPAPARQ